ncbi:hypothetical protein L208DRAFT_1376442 [Tricholoma matsutake]|nr:hypothetical protein L208DRAFT_1376442 [Tricholoma matsutake 945]
MALPFMMVPYQCSLMNTTASSSNTTVVNPPKKCKCGLCGVEGHYSKPTIPPLTAANGSPKEKKYSSANTFKDTPNSADKENSQPSSATALVPVSSPLTLPPHKSTSLDSIAKPVVTRSIT